MGPDRGGAHLMALCAVSSFIWLSYSLEKHSLDEKIRLSSFSILFVSSIITFGLSFFSGWLPGATGRFDDDIGPLKVTHVNHPPRPRRYFLPALVACVVARVELFKWVEYDLQCSKPALECLLPLALLSIEFVRHVSPKAEADNEDDMANTVFDDVTAWFLSSKSMLVLSISLPTYGAYLALQPSARSTVFCSAADPKVLVVFSQWISLGLDSAILILAWRILAWTRTTRSRVKTLSYVLHLSAVGVGFIVLLTKLTKTASMASSAALAIKGIDSLYVFDIVVDSFVFSALLISGSLFLCDSTPLNLTCLITCVGGLFAAVHGVLQVGSFTSMSAFKAWFPLLMLCLGFSMFLFHTNQRSIFFIRRSFLVLFLFLLIVGSGIYSFLASKIIREHALHKLIYDRRIGQDRWLRHASISSSLRVAAQEYKERNDGREPPKGFDAWYQFTTDRQSVIIDHFEQTRQDLLPFWGMKPSDLRDSVRALSTEPEMAIVTVKDKAVSHSLPPESPHKQAVEELVGMVKTFVQHLPDMEFAVNLDESPRVLTPWADLQQLINKGKPGKLSLLAQRSLEQVADGVSLRRDAPGPTALDAHHRPHLSPRDFRQMNAITCPPGSEARSGTYWDIRDLCVTCLAPHSREQFLANWDLSTRLCHQPDILKLHDFYLTSPASPPWQDLRPVFSRSKTDAFSDVLIPLPRAGEEKMEEDAGKSLEMKKDSLTWRGKMEQSNPSHSLLRAGHQTRLVHMVNNATSSEKTLILLPSASNGDIWTYERTRTAELNKVLPFDVGFSDCAAGSACDELGGAAPPADPLDSRYVLLTDTARGPPRRTLAALRSTSVPFVASVFREWYSERLAPWLHYVPVDVRLHALHGTLAYFAGLSGRGAVNGRDPRWDAAAADASWIAEQGRRWAGRALRREDAEIYLFRLLLEWGRLVSDQREGMVFRVGDKKEKEKT
ncbi:uncharacterized protein E0L32_011962 [Thyridium curvatum]|uniref:Glycosyl transferase CAP10 domain-containing protein n=1 Tax=Thyridium curvatum TaxID=1093900 RepID=A0A507BLA6_9PEZI|nr:uncharacterized protein E0L32_011962 [Thyridium curvatum]TPX17961.1 hypothetical protein E0L32_011962 [Thyridium curvatum]